MTDSDLDAMDRDALAQELKRLRGAVRSHRDEKGHDRCWVDDAALYSALPENAKADFTLPDKQEFLANCAKYWQCRQPQKGE